MLDWYARFLSDFGGARTRKRASKPCSGDGPIGAYVSKPEFYKWALIISHVGFIFRPVISVISAGLTTLTWAGLGWARLSSSDTGASASLPSEFGTPQKEDKHETKPWMMDSWTELCK